MTRSGGIGETRRSARSGAAISAKTVETILCLHFIQCPPNDTSFQIILLSTPPKQQQQEPEDVIIPHRTRRIVRPSAAISDSLEPTVSASQKGIKYPRTGKRGAPQVHSYPL
jgi:hypothetical protein